MDKVRAAIVGYGYAGRRYHASLIDAAQGIELCAVASRAPERREQARQDWDVAVYPSVDQLLADESVELVVLATPHDTHKPLAVQCLDAGKHVVTDKLMCMNTAEADQMIDAARRNERMLSVFQNRRWDCDFLTLRAVLAEGRLGELRTIESCVVTNEKASPDAWRSQKRHGGGSFRDWGPHLLDQLLLLVDSPVDRVLCDMYYEQSNIDVDTAARCRIGFLNGVQCLVETGWTSPLPRLRWSVQGTRGTFRKFGVDPQVLGIREGRVDPGLPLPEGEHPETCVEQNGRSVRERVETVPGNWPAYYENIAAHLRRNVDLAVTPGQARRVMRLIDAAFESAELRKRVRLDEPAPG